MKTFNVTATAYDGLPTTLVIQEKEYQTLWIKLDSIGLKNLKIIEITT